MSFLRIIDSYNFVILAVLLLREMSASSPADGRNSPPPTERDSLALVPYPDRAQTENTRIDSA